MATSLIINITNADSVKKQKTVQNVSTSATDAQLYNFAYNLIEITTSTFNSVEKVTKTEIAAPTGGE